MPNIGTSGVRPARGRCRWRTAAPPGSPGPLLRKMPSGSIASRSAAGADGRKHVDVAAVGVEPAQDVVLDAEVVGRHAQPARRRALRRDAELRVVGLARLPTARSRHSNGGVAGHVLDQVGAFHLRNRARLLDQLRRIDLPGGDDAAHHAGRAQHPRQRPRVDVGDGDDVVADEVVAQRAVGAPVAGQRRRLAHDEAGDVRRLRFGVAGRHAVVADLRRGHRDDLAGVGGIGEHFLIAGHARVEHDLAARFAGRAGGDAAVPGAVFESQNCVHLLVVFETRSVSADRAEACANSSRSVIGAGLLIGVRVADARHRRFCRHRNIRSPVFLTLRATLCKSTAGAVRHWSVRHGAPDAGQGDSRGVVFPSISAGFRGSGVWRPTTRSTTRAWPTSSPATRPIPRRGATPSRAPSGIRASATPSADLLQAQQQRRGAPPEALAAAAAAARSRRPSRSSPASRPACSADRSSRCSRR